jgi:hypothetical protein
MKSNKNIPDLILVTGTARNVESSIEWDIGLLIKILGRFFRVEAHIIESDSSDDSVAILTQLSKIDESISFESLGQLANSIPERVDRIRYCRNIYVDYIRSNYEQKKWKHIVIADFDGMNRALDFKGIETTLALAPTYSGIFANQTFGYYDLYALRAQGWIENDPIRQYQESLADIQRSSAPKRHPAIQRIREFNLRTLLIYKQMRRIKSNQEPINVESAFGGFGFYNPLVFLEFDYSPISTEVLQSEHVDLHQKAHKNGFDFVINPRLINSKVNTYNINKIKVVRILRNFRIIRKVFRKFLYL